MVSKYMRKVSVANGKIHQSLSLLKEQDNINCTVTPQCRHCRQIFKQPYFSVLNETWHAQLWLTCLHDGFLAIRGNHPIYLGNQATQLTASRCSDCLITGAVPAERGICHPGPARLDGRWVEGKVPPLVNYRYSTVERPVNNQQQLFRCFCWIKRNDTLPFLKNLFFSKNSIPENMVCLWSNMRKSSVCANTVYGKGRNTLEILELLANIWSRCNASLMWHCMYYEEQQNTISSTVQYAPRKW
jgi:hypothetical protein